MVSMATTRRLSRIKCLAAAFDHWMAIDQLLHSPCLMPTQTKREMKIFRPTTNQSADLDPHLSTKSGARRPIESAYAKDTTFQADKTTIKVQLEHVAHTAPPYRIELQHSSSALHCPSSAPSFSLGAVQ